MTLYLEAAASNMNLVIKNKHLMLHPAKNQTRSWAGFPHGYVIVLDGRQPACVLCLALRKSRSKPKSAF